MILIMLMVSQAWKNIDDSETILKKLRYNFLSTLQ